MRVTRLTSSATALAALLCAADVLAAPNPQMPLSGSQIPQWKSPLPLLTTQPGGTIPAIPTNTPVNGSLQLSFCEFQAQVLPPPLPPTWVWGYIAGPTCPTTVQDTYIGPVLVNTRGTPTTVKWTNQLPTVAATNLLAYKYSTDQTLHWADPLNFEANMCHMAEGSPPEWGTNLPQLGTMCSLNFGEGPRNFFNPVGIPATPHLHGGEVPPAIDGGPDSWFTSFNADGSFEVGHDYYSNPLVPTAANEAAYSYPNAQQAAPLWFHDHTLGATRLNVYMGLAGAYYILDPVQESYFQQIGMRPVTEVIPIVLQDRQFDVNGQLYFPDGFPGGLNGPPTNPNNPYWIPEFLGDAIAINGKVWPYLNVEPRRYRFLFLEGSNARAYEMFLQNQVSGTNGPTMWVIGNDDGFLDYPAAINPKSTTFPHLLMQPGERYEVIVDFSKFAGQTLVLKNVAKAPFPSGLAPQGTTTGQLLQIRVSSAKVTDMSYDPTKGIALRPTPIVRLASNGALAPGVTVSKTRELTLNEAHLAPITTTDPVTGTTQTYPGGPVEILVNNSTWSGMTTRPYGDFTPVTITNPLRSDVQITEYISETPEEGTIELWEIVNTTMDAHPIHTHLASFQVLNRQPYDTKKFDATYAAGFTANLPPGCTGTGSFAGTWCPGYGPPYDYRPDRNPMSGGKWGGNPNVDPYLLDGGKAPDATESGWKDTVIARPGMVTRFLVRWAPQDTAASDKGHYAFSPNDSPTGSVGDSHGYVWHCHIIDHEDNEMMRPDVIVPLAGATRSYVKGVDY